MRQSSLILAGLVLLAGCSRDRDRKMASGDTVEEQADLRLPDTVTRRDTSVALSSRSQPEVSPAEQPVTRTEPPPEEKPAAAPRRQRRPSPSKPAPAPDTTVQGYAPTQMPDTAVADSSTAGKDSTSLARTDSTPAPIRDTTRETAVEPAAADTGSTPGADTMVAPEPAATPPTVARSGTLEARTLPVGTEIHAALDDSITSRHDTVGHTVSAHVMENVTGSDGKTLIPAGTAVRFTITQLRSSRSKSSQGRFALRADGIALNGQLQPVKAEVRPVPRELRGRGVTASDAAKVGGGAAAGAVLGRVIGGNARGAVIGGVAGAAAGTVVATQTATRDVVVKAKTPVVFVLTAPLSAQ